MRGHVSRGPYNLRGLKENGKKAKRNKGEGKSNFSRAWYSCVSGKHVARRNFMVFGHPMLTDISKCYKSYRTLLNARYNPNLATLRRF